MVKAKHENKIKRPAIWIASAFALGITAGAFCAQRDIFVPMLVVILALFAVLLLVSLAKRVNPWAVICIISFTAASVYSFNVYSERYEQRDYSQRRHIITATVLDYDKISDTGIRYRVDNVEIDFKAYPNDMLITVREGELIEVGSDIGLYARVYFPNSPENEGLFDYSSYLADKGIYHVAYADREDISVTENKKLYKLTYIINRFKHSLAQTASKYLSSEAMGIIYAVTSGDDLYITDSVYAGYRRTGTAHVLAISGLHVGFMVMFASILTKRMRKYSFPYVAVNLIMIWAYIAFSGMNISAVRAGLFFSLLTIGKAFRQRCDITNLTFITAFIILAFDPMALFSVSFQLSFAAVLGIGLLSPALTDVITRLIPSFPQNTASAFSTVVSASVGVLLPIAYHFNNVSLVSVAVNLIVVPLFSYITAFGFAVMLVAIFDIAPVLSILGIVTNGLVRMVHIILGFVSSWEYSFLTVASPGTVTIIAAIILMLIISVERPSFIKKALVPALVSAAVLILSIVYPYMGVKEFEISEIKMGEAESTFISTPYNNVILVNAGSEDAEESEAEYTIIPYVLKHQSRDIDYLIITSADILHTGSLSDVLEGIKVHNLVCAESCADDIKQIIEGAECQNINFIALEVNEYIKADGKTFIRLDNSGKFEVTNKERAIFRAE